MYKILFLALIASLSWSCNTAKKTETIKTTESQVTKTKVRTVAEVTPEQISKAKNVIFMVGDGMGLGQITAGMYSNGGKLELERMKTIGLHKCHAGNKLITDSAAGATAFACGKKTYNGAIAVDMDTIPIPTILEEAEEKGLATGLVSTSTIVHATPASFIAHNAYRKNYEAIAADFLKTEVDVFIGGGSKYFNNRSDERDLYEELRAKGYVISDYFAQDFEEVNIDPTKNFAYLTSLDDPLPVAQGRDYLADAAMKSIEMLKARSGDKGFFIMIEGSQIDWGGHANNANYIITEMIDFDQTIGRVLDWAEQDGETLVVVTADHETGGFAIQKESTPDKLVTAFTSDYHTATMIPVFAKGPGEDLFEGIYENTAIYNKMREAFGWTGVYNYQH